MSGIWKEKGRLNRQNTEDFLGWFICLEKEVAPHSSTFAWKIPWTEEPGGLQFMGSLESDTTEWLHFHFHALEKEMETHSCVFAWRIPGTGKPGGLPSTGSHRVGHDLSDLAAAFVLYDTICGYMKVCICQISLNLELETSMLTYI